MAFFRTLLVSAASSANLNGKLLTGSVTNKLARLLLHILGGTRGLVHSPALLGALAIALLLNGSVAFLHSLVHRFLLESDGALLLEVLLAHLLLSRLELGDIGVVTLLRILVCAFQDGILLKTRHLGELVHAAQPRVGVSDAAAEVHPSLEVRVLSALAASPAQAQSARGGAEKISTGHAHKKNIETNKGLKMIDCSDCYISQFY